MRLRGRWRTIADYALMLALFAALALLVALFDKSQRRVELGRALVGDGDSLTLAGQRIRLRGIDAPEYTQTCRKVGADYACGRLARQALVDLIANRPVTCTGSRADRYGRLLGDCEVNGLDLNRTMVSSGWAVAYGDFDAEEKAARAEGRGVWAGEFERPQDWRQRHDGRDEPRHDILAMIGDWLREFFHLR
jgi:endonuclease YncB( thermonuclease family)